MHGKSYGWPDRRPERTGLSLAAVLRENLDPIGWVQAAAETLQIAGWRHTPASGHPMETQTQMTMSG